MARRPEPADYEKFVKYLVLIVFNFISEKFEFYSSVPDGLAKASTTRPSPSGTWDSWLSSDVGRLMTVNGLAINEVGHLARDRTNQVTVRRDRRQE